MCKVGVSDHRSNFEVLSCECVNLQLCQKPNENAMSSYLRRQASRNIVLESQREDHAQGTPKNGVDQRESSIKYVEEGGWRIHPHPPSFLLLHNYSCVAEIDRTSTSQGCARRCRRRPLIPNSAMAAGIDYGALDVVGSVVAGMGGQGDSRECGMGEVGDGGKRG